jgi:transcriptional regulator with XRE-family HTH domain
MINNYYISFSDRFKYRIKLEIFLFDKLTEFSKITNGGLFMENKKFGELVQKLRREKGWTVREFIQRLGDEVSPTYITKIEMYGEIPSPTLICKIADVFGCDVEKMLDMAKTKKVERFEEMLKKKYQDAVGLHRLEKKKK